MMNSRWSARLGAVLIAATAYLSTPPSAEAQGGWVLLGQRSVAAQADRDVIALPGNRRYSEVRICALRSDLRLGGVAVVFGNDQRQQIDVRQRIPAGDCSRPAALRGDGPRNIKRIILRYDGGGGGQPVAQVFGR